MQVGSELLNAELAAQTQLTAAAATLDPGTPGEQPMTQIQKRQGRAAIAAHGRDGRGRLLTWL